MDQSKERLSGTTTGPKDNVQDIRPYNPRGNLGLELTGALRWAFSLPYGCWFCSDGRQVIFNREYMAILERYPGEPARATNPREWVDPVRQEYYYHDGTPMAVLLKTVNTVLADWGLPPMPARPKTIPNIRGLRGMAVRNPWRDVIEGQQQQPQPL
jgi:hypothetical protein